MIKMASSPQPPSPPPTQLPTVPPKITVEIDHGIGCAAMILAVGLVSFLWWYAEEILEVLR